MRRERVTRRVYGSNHFAGRPGWETHSLHDLSAPRPKHGRRGQSTGAHDLWGPCMYVCMFVVHTGSSSRTGGGEQGRNTGRRRKRHRGERRSGRPACLPARLPAGRFCSHARTHCSRPAYISVRFPSHEISRGWAHGASWLSTKDAGPRRQMRWMTGPGSSFSATTFFTLNPHSPSPALFKTWEHRGCVWVTWRDDG